MKGARKNRVALCPSKGNEELDVSTSIDAT